MMPRPLIPKRRHESRRAVFVCTHHVWNVPPFFNVPSEFAVAGSRVWVIGYQARNLPCFERVSPQHIIIRLPVRARSVRNSSLRKMLSLAEFLIATRKLVLRIDPHTVVTFNDPATLLLPMLRSHPSRKICWLLEYPEFEQFGLAERTIKRFSSRYWERADLIVVPTPQRMALHLGLRPRCAKKPCHVVHNSPRLQTKVETAPISPTTQKATEVLRMAKQCGLLAVVYAGAIGNRYAIDKLIQAVAQYSDKAFLLLLGEQHELAGTEVEDA